MIRCTACVCIFAGIAASSVILAAAPPQESLTLTPVFTNKDGNPKYIIPNTPEFAYSFTNTTGKDINLLTLCHQSVLILDGKRYGDPTFYWFGNDVLRPSQKWDTTVKVSEFLPEAQHPGWKWSESVLPSGRHTLSLLFGNQQYGPVSFIWQNQIAP